MSLQAYLFRRGAGKGDKARNDATMFPRGIRCYENIRYGPQGKWHLLNVYQPQGTTASLPTIVSIHGGGYVYGDKDVYHYYCADLARRGFTVVNFSYRLAPEWKFPAPLEDTNKVMKWLAAAADKYHMDPERVFLVGDSAGAQITSHYAAIATNPDYAAHFPFTVPNIRILGVGLNCGMYDMAGLLKKGGNLGLKRDYLGRRPDPDDPRYDPLSAVTPAYPPAHITTSHHDFLRDNAQPMWEFLKNRGVEAQWKMYGTPEQTHIAHVFHCDIRNPEATECNDDQCAFFLAHL